MCFVLKTLFIVLFCGGIIGAVIGEPYLMGSCLVAAIGAMILIMSREPNE